MGIRRLLSEASRRDAILWLAASGLVASLCFGQSRQVPSKPNAQLEARLKKYLQDEYREDRKYLAPDDVQPGYSAAFVDLDGDGIPEAIVYITGWCGSGGCSTLILAQSAGGFKEITSLTITHPPIRVLDRRVNGWRSLSVYVSGGGIQSGYDAELQFDGRSYPKNPSVPPAIPLPRGSAGTVVIGSADHKTATPIF